jgi:hypothetical protein
MPNEWPSYFAIFKEEMVTHSASQTGRRQRLAETMIFLQTSGCLVSQKYACHYQSYGLGVLLSPRRGPELSRVFSICYRPEEMLCPRRLMCKDING